MNKPCAEFADRIIDYVDGELPENEAQAVTQHLEGCESCRRTAEALARSLGLARVLWRDNLGDASGDATASPAYRRQRWVLRYAAVAASILLVAGGLDLFVLHRDTGLPALTLAAAERQVARAGAAAQLLAATHILARCEGTESLVERQYQYILREYGDTPAAESLRAGRELNLGGAHND
jgi:anti-sigma factor RsiW